MVWISLFLISFTIVNCQSKPNFVFIIPDDLGFNEVGYRKTTNTYTPNIDNLRNTGLELSRFYTYFMCSPSRMSLMTGRMAHKIGMQNDIGLTSEMSCGIEPKLENTFFTDRLKHCANYNNYYIGKWHVGMYTYAYLPKKRGFDYFFGYLGSAIDYYKFTAIGGGSTDSDGNALYDWRVDDDIQPQNWEPDGYQYYSTYEIGKKTVNKINNMPTDEPFTLIIAMEAPHQPVHESPDHDALQALNVGLYADSDNQRKKLNGAIYSMDLQIKDIIDALKDNTYHDELWSNTLVFFISDNGGGKQGSNYPLRGKKTTYWEGGIRVPAFLNGGYLSKSLVGKSYDKPIHITDVFATLMDITEVNTNDLELDGKSFKNILDVETPPTTPRTDRNTIILSANNHQCEGSYSGTTLCGAIIKDYGDDGIFKLVIGRDIIGTDDSHGWQELNNQADINAAIPPSTAIFSCNPTDDATLTKPTWDAQTAASYCSNTNSACLFDLTTDPCEYRDLSASTDTGHQTKLSELAQLLIDAYTQTPRGEQVTPLQERNRCSIVTADDIATFWGTFTPSQLEPWGRNFDSSLPADPPVYADNGVCTVTQATKPSTSPPTESSTSPPTIPSTSSITPSPIMSYALNVGTKRRANAVNACGLGGLLSISEDSGDIDAIKQTLLDNSVTQAWIGLKLDPRSSQNYKYKWDDDTVCDNAGGDYCSVYWGPNEPDTTNRCVVLKDNGNIITKACTQQVSYLCDTSISAARVADEKLDETEHKIKYNDGNDDNSDINYFKIGLIVGICILSLILMSLLIVCIIWIKKFKKKATGYRTQVSDTEPNISEPTENENTSSQITV